MRVWTRKFCKCSEETRTAFEINRAIRASESYCAIFQAQGRTWNLRKVEENAHWEVREVRANDFA
jgi:hypothetical protein